MNIDVSQLLSLFSSVGGVDSKSLTESAKAGSAEGFSETFMEQITLLQEQGQLPNNLEELSALQELAVNVETEPLQEFAGLLNDYGKITTATTKTGQKLPLQEPLNKEINIEETIDTLQDVMQHISAVTHFVEEKVSEVSHVIDKVVDFLQADEDTITLQNQPETNEQNLAQLIPAQLEMLDDFGNTIEVPKESLLSQLSKEDAPLESEPLQLVNQNEAVIPTNYAIANSTAAELLSNPSEQVITQHPEQQNLVQKQKILQQIFPGDFEKAISNNTVTDNSRNLTTQEEQSLVAVSSFEQDFMDDMLNKEQGMSKKFSELSQLDKPEEGQFDLTSLSTFSGNEKPVTTYASDLMLINRQVISNNVEIKGELPAMSKPFNHPEWQEEFNERIVWMNNKSISTAEIRLNPQHLGPVSIRIDVNQDQANIVFTAQHGAVREAIEAAIPKLREMLNSQQLNLAEVNVSQQDFSEQKSSSQGFFQEGQKQDSQHKDEFSLAENDSEIKQNVVELTEEIERGRAVASNGLLNIYA